MGIYSRCGIWTALGLAASVFAAGCQTYDTTDQGSQKTVKADPAPAQKSEPASQPPPSTRTADGMQKMTLAFPTGDMRTSAIAIEKATPTEVRLEQPFTYALTATNLTSQTLQSVVVSEKPAANLKITASSPKGQASSDGTINFPLGDLKPRESKTIQVQATATGTGQTSSCASVSYNSSLCSSIDVVEPKLLIVLAGPEKVLKCDEILYTVRITNTGTGVIPNVKVNHPLPAGLTTADGRSSVEMPAGNLGTGQTKEFKIPLKAQKTGSFTSKATASGEAGLTKSSNEVTTVVMEPALKITKTGPKKAFMGRNAAYDITVSNTGDGVARGVVIEDALSTGVKFVKATEGGQMAGNKVTWQLGDLAPGAEKKVRLVISSNTGGVVRDVASASGGCAPTVSASAETEFEGIPAILLEVVDLEDPIEVGANVTYVITATNQGSAPGTNIKIVCNLEDSVQHVSSTGATRGSIDGGTITFAPLGSLAPGQKATWQVVVKAMKVDDVRFKVQMTSDQLTRPVSETEATNLY